MIPPSVATNLATTPDLTGREDEAADQSGGKRSSKTQRMECDARRVEILQPSALVQWFRFLVVFLVFPSPARRVVQPEGQKRLETPPPENNIVEFTAQNVRLHSRLVVLPPEPDQLGGDASVQQQSVHQLHVAFRDDIGYHFCIEFILKVCTK